MSESNSVNLDGNTSDENSSPLQIHQPPTKSSADSLLASFAVAECQEIGRYLVATRDLKKGEIIFQEFPLAVAPQKNSSLICPGCFKTASVEVSQRYARGDELMIFIMTMAIDDDDDDEDEFL